MSHTTSRLADVLTFVTMAGLTFASAAALATYAPAPLHEDLHVVTVLPPVEVVVKRASPVVHQLPTVVITAKRAEQEERVALAAANCVPSGTAVC